MFNKFPNTRTRVEDTEWTEFEVFVNAVEQCPECLIYLLNRNITELGRRRRDTIVKFNRGISKL